MVLDSEGLWDASDVARFLKVSKSWVYLHADANDLPSVKLHGVRRFLPAEIRAFAQGEWSPSRAPTSGVSRSARPRSRNP